MLREVARVNLNAFDAMERQKNLEFGVFRKPNVSVLL